MYLQVFVKDKTHLLRSTFCFSKLLAVLSGKEALILKAGLNATPPGS